MRATDYKVRARLLIYISVRARAYGRLRGARLLIIAITGTAHATDDRARALQRASPAGACDVQHPPVTTRCSRQRPPVIARCRRQRPPVIARCRRQRPPVIARCRRQRPSVIARCSKQRPAVTTGCGGQPTAGPPAQVDSEEEWEEEEEPGESLSDDEDDGEDEEVRLRGGFGRTQSNGHY
jgi:hypothetical protein